MTVEISKHTRIKAGTIKPCPQPNGSAKNSPYIEILITKIIEYNGRELAEE